jgi:putative MFS transporter
LGKIIGPLALALIAGTSNFITPQATADVVLPGFLFLAGCALVSALALTILGVETHGKALRQDDQDRPAEPAR